MLPNIDYNPDVLTCLANLSSDEVFTPPQLANRMLDLLPQVLWSDPDARFLDPVCKSGVFLREIAKRLNAGLQNQMPDQQTRINHIFTQQIFGLGITHLTSLLARRSVYCSKHANGTYSVCDAFADEQGNIRFERIEHDWQAGRCRFCGASQSEYSRDETLETHAYQFIHTDNPQEIWNDMKFDVIIGNPPYQMSDGGFGKSASPIYQKFVQQAKKLEPRYLTMIVPSRWFAGGKGLDEFRSEMLNDKRLSKIVDYADARECFPGVDIAGGVCYFLWERDANGLCEVVNIHQSKEQSSLRSLNEFKSLIRDGHAVSIIRKVESKNEKRMSEQVSSRKPFGLSTNVRPTKSGDIRLRWNGGEGAFERTQVSVGAELIDSWKVITSKVSYDHAGQPDKNGMRKVLSIVDILPPNTICTETYILAGTFEKEIRAKSLTAYLKTKFVRFLVSQLSFSQDITKDRFYFVPIQDFNEAWTDEKLYAKYGLTPDEIAFIESKIRPMDASGA